MAHMNVAAIILKYY